MKIKNKLRLSFLIMIILPVCLVAAAALCRYRNTFIGVAIEVDDSVRRGDMHTFIAIIAILVVVSLILHIWIYSSIVKPLYKLRLAVQNIKLGNLDFEMPKSSNDEIGDVCRDFEEMRVFLKESSDAKINSDREEKELIRNISHDLKTPLTAVKGYVEGILDGVADTPEKQQRYLITIANKVNDMDRLIDELTIYSRLDTNRMPYTFERIGIKSYFDDCCEEIRIDLEAQDIDLDYHCHDVDETCVYADVEQLKRVINNIISNSIKYMKEGRRGRIGIDIYDEGNYAHIIMTDNGRGIAPSEIPHIFERFYRTDESRNSKQGGSGIGLAIVRKIIEDHKGKIWAESVEGEGTTMHICLPKDNMAQKSKAPNKISEAGGN
jgi:signal transduction histidine kinase